MLSNVLRKLICSFKFIQLSLYASYPHFPEKQANLLRKLNIYIYIYLNKLRTDKWIESTMETHS